MKTNFTKGEWMIAENHIEDNNYQYTVLGEYGRIEVATIIRHNFKKVGKSKFKSKDELYPCKEAEANTKLIAAAPEMFEMLQNLKIALKSLHCDIIINDIDKLLKKATQ
jgi:hypothetical protein